MCPSTKEVDAEGKMDCSIKAYGINPLEKWWFDFMARWHLITGRPYPEEMWSN
jgi:hypothetical protein